MGCSLKNRLRRLEAPRVPPPRALLPNLGGVGLDSESITWVGLGGFLVAWLLGYLAAWLAADAKRSLKCFQCKRKGLS